MLGLPVLLQMNKAFINFSWNGKQKTVLNHLNYDRENDMTTLILMTTLMTATSIMVMMK